MDVEIRHTEDCPNYRLVEDRLRALAGEFGLRVTTRLVATAEEAQALGFHGSPSVVVDGRDLFARAEEPVGLACRVYATGEGLQGAPALEDLRAALARAATG